jgi:hypothetical protein
MSESCAVAVAGVAPYYVMAPNPSSAQSNDPIWKFFAQYLLLPAVLAFLGYVFNQHIEQLKADLTRTQTEAQRVQTAQQMIAALFDGNASKAFITRRLMAKVVDSEYLHVVDSVMTVFYKARVDSSIKTGQLRNAWSIVRDAKQIGGPSAETIVASVQRDSQQSRRISAYSLERDGYERLATGDVEGAQKSFQAAEDSVNGLHNAYEIAYLLRTTPRARTDTSARRAVLRTIVTKYSVKAPPELLPALREAAGYPPQ